MQGPQERPWLQGLPGKKQQRLINFTMNKILCQIFRCLPDERIEGGDFEKNDGTGGHSAFTERNFLAEQVGIGE